MPVHLHEAGRNRETFAVRRWMEFSGLALPLQLWMTGRRVLLGSMRSDDSQDRPKEGTVAHALWRFAKIANRTSPHPLDWKRFYQFVVLAHQRRSGLGADSVQMKLREYGFDERHAIDLASAYWHGRCVLYMTGRRLITDSYSAWMKDRSNRWT